MNYNAIICPLKNSFTGLLFKVKETVLRDSHSREKEIRLEKTLFAIFFGPQL